MYYEPYPLTSEEALQTWDNAKKDPYSYVDQHYRTSSNFIMPHMKKVFGITPISIRTGQDESSKRFRKIALYLIANHSTDSIETIEKMFHISADELDLYRNNQILKEAYRDELKAFYEPLIPDELSRLYNHLAIYEKLENLSSEEREDLSNCIGLER